MKESDKERTEGTEGKAENSGKADVGEGWIAGLSGDDLPQIMAANPSPRSLARPGREPTQDNPEETTISSSHSHKVNQNTVQGTSVEEHLKGLDTQELDPSGGTPDTKISHEGPDLPTASLGGEGTYTSKGKTTPASMNPGDSQDTGTNVSDASLRVQRLNSGVYRPFGARSTNTSPDPEQMKSRKIETEQARTVCRGGPGNKQCGTEVKEGHDAVECEKCMLHGKCQMITKAALNALKKWHGTLVWLCDSCSATLKTDNRAPCSCSGLEPRVSKPEALVRHNATKLNDSITNQEKLFLGQGKVLEKISSISSEEQKKSYAEAVKEVGVEIVAQVRPSPAIPREPNRNQPNRGQN